MNVTMSEVFDALMRHTRTILESHGATEAEIARELSFAAKSLAQSRFQVEGVLDAHNMRDGATRH